MNKIRDISGQRFGRLTVLRLTDNRYHGSVLWECLCDCGNTTFVTSSNLVRGAVKSCGCLWRQTGPKIDLSGQRFGRLTVVGPSPERYNGAVKWICKCDCGNTSFVTAGNLKRGGTKSCGCARPKGPKEDLTGRRFGILTVVRLDELRVKDKYTWECRCDCGNTAYVTASNLKSGNSKSCGCLRKKG